MRGLRARGGLSVDLRWADGQLAEASVAPVGDAPAPAADAPTLTVCCSRRVCGASAEAVSAAAGQPVRSSPAEGDGALWQWEAPRGARWAYASQ